MIITDVTQMSMFTPKGICRELDKSININDIKRRLIKYKVIGKTMEVQYRENIDRA